jgi:hypothetical protein
MTADGNWNLVVSTPMRQATLSVKTEGTTLKGSQAANGNSTEIFDGTVNGDEISWKVSITDPMPMTPEFNGTIKGDDVTGGVVLGDFARHSLVRAANHASMLSRPDSVMLSPAILLSRSSDEPFANFGLHCSVQPNRHADIFPVAIPYRPRWQNIYLDQYQVPEN